MKLSLHRDPVRWFWAPRFHQATFARADTRRVFRKMLFAHWLGWSFVLTLYNPNAW